MLNHPGCFVLLHPHVGCLKLLIHAPEVSHAVDGYLHATPDGWGWCFPDWWLGFVKVCKFSRNPLLAESIGNMFFFGEVPLSKSKMRTTTHWYFFVHCIQKQTSYSTYNRMNIWRCPTMGVYHDLPLLFLGFVHEINHPAIGVPPRL